MLLFLAHNKKAGFISVNGIDDDTDVTINSTSIDNTAIAVRKHPINKSNKCANCPSMMCNKLNCRRRCPRRCLTSRR